MSPSSPSDRDREGHPPANRPPPRAPLAARMQAERRAARARIAARLFRPPSAEQRAFDPMTRGRLAAGSRLVIAGVAVVLSSLVHASVYGFGLWFGGNQEPERVRDIVAVEVRERAREPDRPPPPPAPEPERIAKPPPERRRAEPPPPPDRPPPAPSGKPPPRVVGLSLDSTSQGGAGPSFGVGNTRQGQTAERAADPRKVGRAEPPPSASPNQQASRIPSAGAKYVLPRRKRPIKPPYPQKLQTQGIEASVTVMVNLDRSGAVTSVKIIKGSGYPEFDESAKKTAFAESFEPATRDGNPIPYTLSYTYRFTIEQK